MGLDVLAGMIAFLTLAFFWALLPDTQVRTDR